MLFLLLLLMMMVVFIAMSRLYSLLWMMYDHEQ